MIVRVLLAATLCAGWALHGISPAQSQAYPSKPIKMVVPFPPGGSVDVLARVISDRLGTVLGQSIVIENRGGGAGGSVGAKVVASADPDGYTILLTPGGSLTTGPAVHKNLGYDPLKAFVPVGLVMETPQAVSVYPGLPVKTMAEFVSHAKANPGKLNYGSSGAGGLTHFAVELFQARTGTSAVHIPFKGGAPSTAAVVSGEVDFAFANMTDAMPQIEAGTVRGLAVTSLERSPYFPDLPSVHEAVVPTFIVETWNGIMTASKTPEPVIRKLSEILIKMADDPEVKEVMRRAGANTVKTTPEQYRAQIHQEIAQWKPLIAEIAEKEKK